MTFVSEYVTQNITIDDIGRAYHECLLDQVRIARTAAVSSRGTENSEAAFRRQRRDRASDTAAGSRAICHHGVSQSAPGAGTLCDSLYREGAIPASRPFCAEPSLADRRE